MGEEVCLVRSGCLLHLRRYAQLPDYATEPLPPPAAELNAAVDIIKTLPPVTCYKVLAVAYCQYPKPTPPPVQQQPDVTGLAPLALATAPGQQQQQLQGSAAGPAAQQQQGQQLQQQQQQQAGPHGMSKSRKKSRSRSKSLSSWGLGYDDEDDEERSGNEDDEEADESESNSEDDEFNDRNIHLTGIDSDTDGLASASRQQQSASQSMQQHGQQPSQQQVNGEAAQQQQLQLQQQQQQQAVVAQQRPPCMWLLLCPVGNASTGNSHGAQAAVPGLANGAPEDELDDMLGQHLQPQEPQQQQPGQQKLPCVAVPLHIDGDLPDYLVQPSMFEASLQRRWLPQDRCSMFIGSRQVRDTPAVLTLTTKGTAVYSSRRG